MNLFYTKDGRVVSNGIEVSNFVLRELSKTYTRDGWRHSMEARLSNGATLLFDLSSEDRNNPEAWRKELGPDARFDARRDGHLLLDAAEKASEAGWDWAAEAKPDVWCEEDGTYQRGLRLADFEVLGVKKRTIKVQRGFFPGDPTAAPSTETAFELTTRRAGKTRSVLLTPEILTSPYQIASAIGDGATVCEPGRLACYLGGLMQAAE